MIIDHLHSWGTRVLVIDHQEWFVVRERCVHEKCTVVRRSKFMQEACIEEEIWNEKQE